MCLGFNQLKAGTRKKRENPPIRIDQLNYVTFDFRLPKVMPERDEKLLYAQSLTSFSGRVISPPPPPADY